MCTLPRQCEICRLGNVHIAQAIRELPISNIDGNIYKKRILNPDPPKIEYYKDKVTDVI